MRRFNFSEKGFTLIELIVVMLIIGFSSSLVFLNFKSNSDVDDKRFALYFVRILEKARVKSIVEDKVYTVVIDPDERVVSLDNSSERVPIPKTITITAIKIIDNDGKFYIYFYGNGSSTGMNLNLYSEKISKKILVNQATGLIKSMDIVI